MISGKVLSTVIDENGNIKVQAEYTLTDGSKKIGHTRYNFVNFSAEAIQKDVKTHCETLMKRVYALKAHQEMILIDMTNIKYDCTSVEMIIKPAVTDVEGNITTPAETLTIDDKQENCHVQED